MCAQDGQPAAPRDAGSDVSKYQGEIEWQDVSSAGTSFAYLRASVGTTYVDPTYLKNRAEAQAWGIAAGAYHAAHPLNGQDTEAEARAEAEYFLAAAKPRSGDLRPVLDIELTKGPRKSELVTWLFEWLITVERNVGTKPIIYTSPSFWHDVVGDSQEFADAGYSLWIAHYKDPAEKPTLPGGWKSYVFWQYSDDGKVPGIKAPVGSRYCCRRPIFGRLPAPTLTSEGRANASADILGVVRVATLRSSTCQAAPRRTEQSPRGVVDGGSGNRRASQSVIRHRCLTTERFAVVLLRVERPPSGRPGSL
jgi:GH25 family lysozyme M1 (1,4-beta-N-acetylmuramidase)